MTADNQDTKQSPPFIIPILVCAAVALLWLIPYIAMSLKGGGSGAGIWGIFSLIALPATVIAPVAYGRMTRDTIGAILIGVLPFLLVMTVPRLLSGEIPQDTGWLAWTVLYIVSLCTIGGLEGFFASRRDEKSLVVAVLMAGAWFWVFLSGIN